MASFRDAKIADIREQVGRGRVICGLSGGVDSAVAAVLIHEAIGDQLTCVFVDHGLMRLGEAEQVVSLFRNSYNIPLVHVDASARLPRRPRRRLRPREKRKFIGTDFINVFEAEASKIGGADFLAQGTLYPGRDRERQLHRRAVGDDQEPPQCRRPARADEHEAGRAACANCSRTRSASSGASSACPKRSSNATRFPGPASRSASPARSRSEKCDILRKADAIYLEEIRNAGLYDAIWQAFAVLLPVRTVGVMGDYRTYDYVCALRAVTSVDGMTADIYPFDAAFLSRVATRIVNEVQGINRVVYDYTSKPPGTIEWE